MSRAATAYHEAGHAVAVWHLLHKAPRRATIVPTKDSLGHVQHENPLRGIRLDIDGSDRAALRAERVIMICLAGPIAQKHAFPRSFRYGHASGDNDRAVDLALRLCGSGEMATAYLRWLNIKTSGLVECRWPFIERVAERLLREDTLDGPTILETILPPPQRGKVVVSTTGILSWQHAE